MMNFMRGVQIRSCVVISTIFRLVSWLRFYLINCINEKSGIVVSQRDFEEMYEPSRGKTNNVFS